MYSDPQRGSRGQWRLDLRAAFTKETTLLFYGIGNASPWPPPGAVRADYEYQRIHPTGAAQARLALTKGWFLQGGVQYTHNSIIITDNSLLARLRAGDSASASFLRGDPSASHGVGLLDLGVMYDTRDNETVTRHGMFHSAHVRISPPLGRYLPYAYQQVNATARFYVSPWPRWLTVSYRLVGDLLFGSPPFYELARYEETAAVGGVKGVRGVPAQRYYGKVKVFQNLEARSEIWPFRLWGKPMVLGVALFADAGRVWSELTPRHTDLDGTGVGLKYGLGGGLRLKQGETFVVRVDLAWSPDARPVGAYFAAGEIF
jgi:outer membrane protein assembly factor BamA